MIICYFSTTRRCARHQANSSNDDIRSINVPVCYRINIQLSVIRYLCSVFPCESSITVISELAILIQYIYFFRSIDTVSDDADGVFLCRQEREEDSGRKADRILGVSHNVRADGIFPDSIVYRLSVRTRSACGNE